MQNESVGGINPEAYAGNFKEISKCLSEGKFGHAPPTAGRPHLRLIRRLLGFNPPVLPEYPRGGEFP